MGLDAQSGASVTQGTLAARPAAAALHGLYYATDTGQLSYSDGTTWTDFGPSSDGTLTIEEASLCVQIGEGGLSATDSTSLFVAQYDCIVASFSIVDAAAQGASDVDYWTVNLRKFVAGASVGNMASKSTKTTGGQAILAHRDWNFDSVAWDAGFRQLAKGDVLNLEYAKTGAATNRSKRFGTFRIEPVR